MEKIRIEIEYGKEKAEVITSELLEQGDVKPIFSASPPEPIWAEKLEKDAINWFKMHIGNLSGYSMLQRDKAYSLAIRVLEERQAMKESRKSPTPRGLK